MRRRHSLHLHHYLLRAFATTQFGIHSDLTYRYPRSLAAVSYLEADSLIVSTQVPITSDVHPRISAAKPVHTKLSYERATFAPMASTTSSPTSRTERGGGRGRAARDGLLALRPAHVSPRIQPIDNESIDASQQDTDQTSATASRGSRRAPRGRHAAHVVESRHFGGNLTQAPGREASSNVGPVSLQPNAPSFIPGQPFPGNATNTRPAAQQTKARKRRLSRSTAPDIASRIHEDIDNRQYECPICTNEVLRNSKIWSCRKCWTVLHMGCVKQWSTNSEAAAAEQAERSGQRIAPHQWRCPGCNIPQNTKPRSYTCWCEKEHEPRPIIGIPPHSCGQTCGKPRILPKKCPHPCELLCHAGPCPPCSHMGPKQSCFCGKQSSGKRCIDTDYEGGWSCGSVCGDAMPCGEHTCDRPCHEGLCGACEVRVDARCYCGQEDEAILCCDRDDDKPSKRIHTVAHEKGEQEDAQQVVDSWTGTFQCTNTCERQFDCGKHLCQQPCHATTTMKPHCPRAPDVVKHCPCGKTLLEEIMQDPRSTCEDAIPHCQQTCLKSLACGHPCQQTCHLGDCMSCLQTVTIRCRCKRTELSTICHQGVEESPQCMRVCHATLNCGRHECGERCCPGERKAIERQAAKKRGRPLGSTRPLAENFEAEHICTRSCGRLLKCGNHTCEDLCHKGPCGSCREAIFDEISCQCGRTILQPPLPCGTKPPPCRWDCERPKACGHPQVQHNCHTDDEACPRCPFLMEKQCLCSKKMIKNQQCWFTDTRCGMICGSRLKCGLHTCRKTCHRPGDCEDGAGKCTQPCGKPKKVCSHPCEDLCHAPYPCKQDKPCAHKTLITCPCQHKKQEARCGASATNPSSATSNSLKCDEECGRLERNRQLAVALEIDPDTHTNDHVPYSTESLALFSALPTKWAQDQEREFRVFAAAEDEKRLRFKPMLSQQRAFLHALAEDFGLDSESMDPEPHRHVAIFKTPRFVSAPAKTLRDCVRIRQNQRTSAAAEASAQYQQQQAQPQVQARSKNVPAQPYNGFILSQPGFGLTTEDLDSAIEIALGSSKTLVLQDHFLPSGDVAMLAFPARPPVTPDQLEAFVRDAKPALSRTVNSQKLGQLQMAHVTTDYDVTYRESDSTAPNGSSTDGQGGWSQIAAKSAIPRLAPVAQTFGSKSSFTVLGTGKSAMGVEVIGKKKEKKERERKAKASIVDDWEMEIDKESAHESAASGVSDGAGTSGQDMKGTLDGPEVAQEFSVAQPADEGPPLDAARE